MKIRSRMRATSSPPILVEGDCISNTSILRATSQTLRALGRGRQRRTITAGRLASRWLSLRWPDFVNIQQSQRGGSGARVLGCAAGAQDRVRALACVADLVRVAAREQDDIAAAYVLDVRVSVDPKHQFAIFDDVQAADIGEADRESPQRSVHHNDPFSAQTDAPEQLREQVVRLTICVEAERGFLKRWRIGRG